MLYLLELTVTLRDWTNGFPIAVGNSYHTSLTRESPEKMVDEVMTNIFKCDETNRRATESADTISTRASQEYGINLK